MISHAAGNYVCPICVGLAGGTDGTLIREGDWLVCNRRASALIASYFIPGNEGHVLVVPTEHYENIYTIPEDVLADIGALTKQMAWTMRQVYNCDGVTLLQNNEPEADQHALHLHMHVFPRHVGDSLHPNMGSKYEADVETRACYAERVRAQLP